jgi:transcription-repair coupling factor (superfamily II helicase)
VEALRVGLAEVVRTRQEVRLAPVSLADSQEIRLRRLAPRAVINTAEKALFIPVPGNSPAAALTNFIRTMWPPDS